MIPEEDENNMITINMMEEEEPETSQVDFSTITKHPYISKVFCWIGNDFFYAEQGNTAEVKRFFDTFPHLLNNFTSNNNWNPFLYAARYGNYELIDYFSDKKMKTTTSGRILSSYSIVHTAVYSGEAAVLDYILNKIDVSVNPFNCEASPLKVAMKANNPKMVEMLVAKGAYYVFGDVFNNVYQKPNIEEQNKYYSIQSNRDIPISMVVEEGIIKDCPIKETLKYARVKSIIAMKIMADKASHNMDVKPQFLALASILSNSENMIMLLKMAVNRGESILSNKANAASLEQNDQIC